jgi:hypothetical protein
LLVAYKRTDLGCIEEEEEYCCYDGGRNDIFNDKEVERGEPTTINGVGGNYQNVFRDKVVGSQIDNSHACPFPPSSENVGVDGRKDCLMSKTKQGSHVNDEKNPGEYVTGESIVTLRACGVVGSVYQSATSHRGYIRLRIKHSIILPLCKTIQRIRNATAHQNPRKQVQL